MEERRNKVVVMMVFIARNRFIQPCCKKLWTQPVCYGIMSLDGPRAFLIKLFSNKSSLYEREFSSIHVDWRGDITGIALDVLIFKGTSNGLEPYKAN